MPEPLTVYDRPKVALMNLLAGRPLQAGQALVAPERLPPQDRRSFAERHGMTGLTKWVADTVTNPLVLFALLMNFRYPVSKAANLLKYKKGVLDEANRAGFLLRNVGTLHQNFGGTRIPDIADDVMADLSKFQERHGVGVLEAIQNYAATTGKTMDQRSMTRIFQALDGASEVGGPFQKAWKLTNPLWRGRLTAEEAKVAQAMRTSYTNIFQDLFGSVSSQKVTLGILGRRQKRAIAKARRLSDWLGKHDRSHPMFEKMAAEYQRAKSLPQWLGGKNPKTVGEIRQRLNDVGYAVAREGPAENLAQELIALSKRHPELQQDIESLRTIRNRGEFVKFLQQSGMTVGDRSLSEIQYLQHYAPHMIQMTSKDFEGLVASTIEEARGSEVAMGKAISRSAASRVSPHSFRRLNQMIPDPRELRTIANELDPQALSELERQVAETMKLPETRVRTVDGLLESLDKMTRVGGAGPGPTVARYSTLSTPVFERYLQSTSKHFSWTVQRHGKAMLAQVDRLEPLGKAMMENTYIPQMLGRGTFRQSIQSMAWSQQRDRWVRMLTSPEGMTQYIPKSVRKWMVGNLMSARGPLSAQAASGGLANYFYLSTLGYNLSSSGKNLLQTALTTIPTIGGKHTLRGFQTTTKNAGRWFSMVRGGMDPEVAFRKAFSEMLESGLEPSPLSTRMLKKSLEDAWTSTRVSLADASLAGRAKLLREFQNNAMSIFQASELFNRSVAFYGGHAKALAEGIVPEGFASLGEFASRFGRDVVRFTQFPAGPGQSPYALSNVPGIFRQFLHFPLRYMGFLGYSTLQGVEKGRNWGPLARSVGLSAAMYEAGRDLLGADLSQGLMMGALPLPMGEDSPFYPLPIVPPVLSLGGSAAMSLLSGNTEAISRTAPLLLPAGVALRRGYRFLAPKYADYQHPNAEGQVPLYTKSGTLLGYHSKSALVSRAMGAGDLGAAQESSLMRYLLAQRDKLRAYRREYLEAIVNNQPAKARKVQEAFQKEYPQFGPIKVRAQDIRAVQMRRRIGRLERVLDTMPPEYRGEYGRMISEALGTEVESLLGIDPSLLEQSNLTARTRRGPRFNAALSPRASASTGQVGMRGYQPPSTAMSLRPGGTGGFQTFSFGRGF